MSTIFPWLTSAWEQLVHYKSCQRVPTALLLTGEEGIGKSALAELFAQLILCQTPGHEICGKCRSCQLFVAGNHPDYLLVQPEEESVIIKIDQVRNVVHFLGQTRMCSNAQVAVLIPAEGLNRAAANSLLKTLEEPRGSVLIILVSHKPSLLPATIRSRCQQIKIAIPTKKQALDWLAREIGEQKASLFLPMVDYMPLKALQYAENNSEAKDEFLLHQLLLLHQKKEEPIHVASLFSSHKLSELFGLLSFLVMDMIRAKFQIDEEYINTKNKIAEIRLLSHNLSLRYLFNFLDQITEASRLIIHNSNVNSQLLLEKIFIQWCYNHDIN